jgi:hypothetical protein
MQVPYEYINRQIVAHGTTNHDFSFVPNYDCSGETLTLDVFEKGVNKIKTIATGVNGGKRYKSIRVTGNFSNISRGSDYTIKVTSLSQVAGNTFYKTVAKGNLIIK